MAYNDPMACPYHSYNLEWRTCLNCDIIKLTAQGSSNFVPSPNDIFSQIAAHPSNAREAAAHHIQYTAQPQRHTPQATSTTYFSANHPYNFNTSNGRGDYPERLALTPTDLKSPEDLALSEEEKVQKPRRSRNRLQKKIEEAKYCSL